LGFKEWVAALVLRFLLPALLKKRKGTLGKILAGIEIETLGEAGLSNKMSNPIRIP